MEKEEHVAIGASVLSVQLLDALDGCIQDGLVLRLCLRIRVGEIAEDRKEEVRVAVCEILNFNVRDCLVYCAHAGKQRGHHHCRAEFIGNAVIAEFHFREHVRRHEHRDELVHNADRYLVCGEQRQKEYSDALTQRVCWHYPENHKQKKSGDHAYASEVQGGWVTLCPPIEPLLDGRLVPRCLLQF